jgi:hypothetical protein
MDQDAKTAAAQSLARLEADFAQYETWERQQIEQLRERLRGLVTAHGAPAALAIIAVGFEVAMGMGQ